jgi:pimeloyl-ACP methyl ester carboxylesterase
MNNPEAGGTVVLPAWADKLGKILRLLAKISPTTTAHLMALLWFKPFMPKSKEHVKEWQKSADQIIPLSIGNAYVFGEKDKPLVLCVHGWRGRAHQLRRFIQPLKERGFRVAMINLPAHGDDDLNRTDLYHCASLVHDVWNEVGPVDALVAHSFGSPVCALSINEKYMPRKLAMVSGNFDIHYILQQYSGAFGLANLVSKIEQRLKIICNKQIFEGSWEQLTMDNVILKLMKVDTHLWHDLEDTEINTAANEEVFAKLSNGQLTEVSGVGHFDILKSEEVIMQVSDYIAAK